MTLLSGFLLFLTNFLILSLFVILLLHQYNRKREEMDRFLNSKLMQEREELEELSTKLLKTSELLISRLDQKEKKMNSLFKKMEQKAEVLQVKKVPILNRQVKPSTVKKSSPREEGEALIRKAIAMQHPEDYFSETSKYKEIYFLADKGMGIVDIARKTGKTKGEIDLVLSLRKATKTI